jgi:putative DNA primase/helicase
MEILPRLGVGEEFLRTPKKEGPCPLCGGKTKFRFDNLEGRGTWFCHSCGAGDGVSLVMLKNGWEFMEAALAIEEVAGVVKPSPAVQQKNNSGEQKIKALKRVWSESMPLQHGDEAMRYLAGRGINLSTPPDNLRLHQELAYYDGEKVIGTFPAMVALVQAPDGSGATLHRTFLKDGRKAPVESPKKLMSPVKPFIGGAIRLAPVSEVLGIAEGQETALAAAAIFGIPTWSCINAQVLEAFVPPAGVTRITVFADNDQSFTGQKSAYAAAFRLTKQGYQVDVKVPPQQGDWLDELVGARIRPLVGEPSCIHVNQRGGKQ